MRIVSRETFLSLPNNVLYAKYKPCVFGDICIKGDTWENDFLEQFLTQVACHDDGEYGDILETARLTGSSFKIDLDCYGRDGMFDEDQLFVIWEAADVDQLINRLKEIRRL